MRYLAVSIATPFLGLAFLCNLIGELSLCFHLLCMYVCIQAFRLPGVDIVGHETPSE